VRSKGGTQKDVCSSCLKDAPCREKDGLLGPSDARQVNSRGGSDSEERGALREQPCYTKEGNHLRKKEETKSRIGEKNFKAVMSGGEKLYLRRAEPADEGGFFGQSNGYDSKGFSWCKKEGAGKGVKRLLVNQESLKGK